MKKLLVKNIDNYNYYLSDNENNYRINIEFYDTDYKPIVGDILYIDENLLKEVNNQMINCGPIDSDYGKVGKELEKDMFIFINGDKKIYLKRYYG